MDTLGALRVDRLRKQVRKQLKTKCRELFSTNLLTDVMTKTEGGSCLCRSECCKPSARKPPGWRVMSVFERS